MDFTPLHQRFREHSKQLDPIGTGTIPALQHIPGIEVIAYDFYGTLFLSGVGDIGIDDGSADEELLVEALEHSGIDILSQNAGKRGFELYNEIVEKNMNQIKNKGIEYPEPDIRNVWREVLDQMESEELISIEDTDSVENAVSVEFEARMNPVWPSPKAVETLKAFKENGFPQGIISNSQFYTPIVLEALAEHSLEELGFKQDLLHWSFEEKQKKPGLDFYEAYLDKLQAYNSSLKPEKVLYVGNDMLKDIYPAHHVGMKTALFAGDKRSLKWRKDDDRCKGIQPDIVITSLHQLADCVEF